MKKWLAVLMMAGAVGLSTPTFAEDAPSAPTTTSVSETAAPASTTPAAAPAATQ